MDVGQSNFNLLDWTLILDFLCIDTDMAHHLDMRLAALLFAEAYRAWNNGLCANLDMPSEQRAIAAKLLAEHGSIEVL